MVSIAVVMGSTFVHTESTEVKVLDSTKSYPVKYCVDLWVRDEQIKLSTARIKERIQPATAAITEPIAVVCFGPSLADTWVELKKFRYIITCSGAHKFLVDHDIIPTYHIDVDPRAHKVKLIGTPHKDVQYLIASACHPDVFDHLEGFNVKLWHIFDCADDALRTLPHGEWALTGGSSAGLRAMTVARFLGFNNQHIFGMDGCEGATGKHAAEHPNQAKGHATTVYEGVEYKTTVSMLECAKQTFHELNQMPDVKATFYGEGLVQAMAKNYKPEPVSENKMLIGFNKPKLITPYYAKLNAELHQTNIAYGVGGGRHAPIVIKLCESLKTKSVLDYGCGRSYLAKELDFPIWEYDPAIPGKSDSPRPADLVVCTDVLEHVEPELLHYVLNDLARCVKVVGYFVIHTGPSTKSLSDGRNSHLIQKPPQWWEKALGKHFILAKHSIQYKAPLITAIVGPRKK